MKYGSTENQFAENRFLAFEVVGQKLQGSIITWARRIRGN